MSDVAVGNGCVVTPKIQVINRRELRDGTIVFGDNFMHRQGTVKKRTGIRNKRMLKDLQKSYLDRDGRTILKKPKNRKSRRAR